jgi:hypothetical protein
MWMRTRTILVAVDSAATPAGTVAVKLAPAIVVTPGGITPMIRGRTIAVRIDLVIAMARAHDRLGDLGV